VAATTWAAGSVTVEVPQLQSAVTAVVPSVLEQTTGVETVLVVQYLVAALHVSPAVVPQEQVVVQNLRFVHAPRRMKAGAAEVTATSATSTQRVAFICIV